MKVITLVENTEGNAHCPTEHGLSYYIETGTHRILFDAGADDLVVKNAEQLGVDLSAVDIAILSHGHYDHGGGLPAFLNINHTAAVYVQKRAFGAFYSIHAEKNRYIGLPEELRDHNQLVLLEGDYTIDSSLSLFTIHSDSEPRPSANHSLKEKSGESFIPDSFDHEQCLVIQENGCRYLFSGCAHHGILNILNSFHELYHSEPDAVFSGFHMNQKEGYSDEDIQVIVDTAMRLSSTSTTFFTGHCTGTAPYEAMKKIMGDQLHYLHCGDSITLDSKKKGTSYMKLHKLFAWGTVVCFVLTMITGYKRK